MPVKVRQVIRELGYSLTAILPYARSGAGGQADAISNLAAASNALKQMRRIEQLPWQAVLEVNFSHITAEEREALADGVDPYPFVLCMSNATSCLLHAPAPLEGATESTPMGVATARIYAFAREHGFEYVRLDVDALPLPGFSIYEPQHAE